MSPVKAKLAICAVLVGFLIPLTLQRSVVTANNDETPTPTPFPTSFPAPIGISQTFACPDTVILGEGPTWRGIEVGVSDLQELEQAWPEVYNPEEGVEVISETSASQYIKYGRGYVCVQDNIVVTLSNGDTLPYLADYIAAHGEPDAITWTPTYDRRVAFWFRKGFAIEILTNTVDRSNSAWGRISGIFYFPYQDVEGFEQRWPYNATQPEMPSLRWTGDVVPTQQNPFDFDNIIATISAQPTRTLTPTSTPRASTPTATSQP